MYVYIYIYISKSNDILVFSYLLWLLSLSERAHLSGQSQFSGCVNYLSGCF